MLIGLKCLVVGGGIGGLAAALALARRGASVTVHEQASEISEVGAGIQISPNGAVVLAALGLEVQLVEQAVRARAVNLVDGHSDKRVLRLDLTALDTNQSYLFLHRADLIALLLSAARDAGVEICLNSEINAHRSSDGNLDLRTADGEPTDGDLVVLADGVRSRMRACVNDAAEPRFTGQVAWRATVALDHSHEAEVSVHMGAGRHVVAYPLRDRRMLNIVAVREEADWAEEGWNHPDDPAHVVAAFADFSSPVQHMLSQVESVHRWGLFRHPVATSWHRGNMALLGDAAHPTLPFLAQGACMAIEDAWVLAECLSQSDAIEPGLALYQMRRRDRCVRIVEAANSNARIYHMRNPAVRAAMHAAMRIGGALAPSAPLRRFNWLYKKDVTTAP